MKIKTRVFLVMMMMAVFCIVIIFSGEYKSTTHTVVIPPKETLPSKPQLLLDTYVPISKDTVWTYDTPKGTAQVWVDFLKGNVFQVRIDLGEEMIAKVFVEDEDAIFEVATVKNAFSKIDYTHLRQYKDTVLRFPIESGDTWELTDGTMKKVVSTEERRRTGFGEVNAIKLKATNETYDKVEYFGEQLGMIYAEYEGEDGIFTMKLNKIEFNKRVTEEINVYAINDEKKEIELIQQLVPIRTNEEAVHFMTDILQKNVDEKYLAALPPNTMITNIYRDQDLKQVHVELNEAYLHMAYTAEEKQLALQALVNTIADYYHVEEVGLTVEGSPYYSWVKKQ